MKTVITSENIRSFAYVNDGVCTRPVKGVAIDFMGLGGMSMYDKETPRGERLGAQGILYVVPYLNPWAWMNPHGIKTADEIIDAVKAMCGAQTAPVISVGGSMGGLSALIYSRYSRHKPVGCVANCPVCDLPYHYTERPDLPRTLYSAFGDMDEETLDAAMEKFSPLHLAQKGDMPHISYAIFHCEKDMAVNKQKHSDRFVEAMNGFCPVEYHAVPDRGHCDLPDDVVAEYEKTIADFAVR